MRATITGRVMSVRERKTKSGSHMLSVDVFQRGEQSSELVAVMCGDTDMERYQGARNLVEGEEATLLVEVHPREQAGRPVELSAWLVSIVSNGHSIKPK